MFSNIFKNMTYLPNYNNKNWVKVKTNSTFSTCLVE